MDRFNSLFDSQFIYALGWTIVHSFWQSLLVFALLCMCLLMCKRSRPEIRYGLSTLALVCCLLISIKTFIYCYQDVVQASQLFSQLQTTLDTSQVQNWWVAIFTTINPWLDTIVLLWCVGFIIQGIRYAYDITLTQQLKKHSVYHLPEEWNERLQRLVLKLGVNKSVTFMHSTKINVPSVIGHFKPMILLPLGILSQLPQAHVEAIVLHELAHVKRHDYLINIVLCLIKVLFFYNPLVLTISKKISIERENICDDLAVKACGDPLAFANSLSQFADVTTVSQSAMAASKDKYLLLDRVKRLFPKRGNLSSTTERLIALVCAGLLGLTINVNAKNQPVPSTLESAPMQQESNNVVTEQDTYSNTAEENPSSDKVVNESNMSSGNDNDQAEGTDEIIVASSTTDNSTMTVQPTQQPTQNNQPVPETAIQTATVSEKPQQDALVKSPKAVFLAKNNSIDASSEARNYIESINKNEIKATEVKESQETKQTQQQLTGRVYASTDKFGSFSLESPHALDNIEQIIFAPISTSDTKFSESGGKAIKISSQYFSEEQSKQPKVFKLDTAKQFSPAPTDLSSALIAQIRIKEVKMYNARPILANDNNFTWTNKSSANPNNRNTMAGTDELTKNFPKLQFILEVVAEVVLVKADSYELVGYGLKGAYLDSTEFAPGLLDVIRHNGESSDSRTREKRDADKIKAAWDIVIESVQSDVYQVASSIKNQELELTSLEHQAVNNAQVNKNLASQYFALENSEFEEFVISAADSIKDFKNASYTPIIINDVQLESKFFGWKERAKIVLSNLARQSGQTYNLVENVLTGVAQNEPIDTQSLLVQIDVKAMELYNRSANRIYREIPERASRGSNYNRGAVATGTGLSPSKDDVGGGSVRKNTMAKSAFDSTLYLRGQFEITLIEPDTHQILGFTTAKITIKPSHSEYKDLAKQIREQDIEVPQESVLLLALFDKVKTKLHNEIIRIQQDQISVIPIQLTKEKAKTLTNAPLARAKKIVVLTNANVMH